MVWAREASRFSDALPGSYVEVLGWFAGKKLSHHQLAFRLNDKNNLPLRCRFGVLKLKKHHCRRHYPKNEI